MPCMGPDLKEARKRGKKVGERLIKTLIKKEKLYDIDRWGADLPGSSERWKKAKNKFVTSVADLFEESAANSF